MARQGFKITQDAFARKGPVPYDEQPYMVKNNFNIYKLLPATFQDKMQELARFGFPSREFTQKVNGLIYGK